VSDRPIESLEKRSPFRGTGQQALDIRGLAGRERNGMVNRVFLREMTNPDRTADTVVRYFINEVLRMAKTVG